MISSPEQPMLLPMLSQLIHEFVDAVNPYAISEDEGYKPGQIGHTLSENNDLEDADLVLLGIDEWRGMGMRGSMGNTDQVRSQLYNLYLWHSAIRISDAGNLKNGVSLTDTYAAVTIVLRELLKAGKRVLLFGGSHDMMLAAYRAFAEEKILIESTAVDALIDLEKENPFPAHNFLLEMLTSEPNYVKHFNLVGFQSYFVNPNLLETIDKLRFDCYRVGKVQERLEEVEPSMRSSHLVSFDMNALAHAYAPVSTLSPNGFTGQDACKLMQYSGMSTVNRVSGIHGFGGKDVHNITAIQVAQMIWYFIDGMQKQLHESPLQDRSAYNEFHTICAEVDTLFLQSRNTGRWWMQLPDHSFIPCTQTDYVIASHNDLPERWLRAQERL